MDMSLCRRFGSAKPALVARLEKAQESVHVEIMILDISTFISTHD